MSRVYFYCARSNMNGVQTLSSGVITVSGDVTEDIYQDVLRFVCEKHHLDTSRTVLTALNPVD